MHDALSTGQCFHDFLFESLLIPLPLHAAAFPMIFSGAPFVQVRARDYHDVRPVKDRAAGGLLTYRRLQQTIRDGGIAWSIRHQPMVHLHSQRDDAGRTFSWGPSLVEPRLVP